MSATFSRRSDIVHNMIHLEESVVMVALELHKDKGQGTVKSEDWWVTHVQR
jgi:hypothetical protein